MKILVLNDLHAGSNYALAPKFRNRNPFQDWVHQKYESIVNYSKEIELDYIVTIGDMTDGYGKMDSTSHWTTDINDQVNAAVDLIKAFVQPKTKVIGVGGSGYHRGKGTGFDSDRSVVDLLNGEYNRGSYYMNTPYGIIQFIHVSKNIKTEANLLRINNGEIDGPKVRFLVAGHLHRYEAYEIGSIKIVHCPCWQYPTDFMQGFGVSTSVDIGCLIINIDEFGISLNPIRFPIPIEVMQGMSGWIEVSEKQIIERNKKDMERLSQLSGISTNVIQVIKNIESKFNIPKAPIQEEIKKRSEEANNINIPKM